MDPRKIWDQSLTTASTAGPGQPRNDIDVISGICKMSDAASKERPPQI
jgi:hypothetical protein